MTEEQPEVKVEDVKVKDVEDVEVAEDKIVDGSGRVTDSPDPEPGDQGDRPGEEAEPGEGTPGQEAPGPGDRVEGKNKPVRIGGRGREYLENAEVSDKNKEGNVLT